MKFSPCLSPISVYNESLGTTVAVPCGHCSACITNKGFRRKLKVEEQFLRYRYRFFVTLTFADVNLPRANFVEDDLEVVSTCDKDYNGRFHFKSVSDFNDDDMQFIYDTVNKFGFVPVLSHSEISKFKKRLRYYITKQYGKNNLFVYTCGEYGPTTYRPHYHILLATNDGRIADSMQRNVIDAWSPRTACGHYSKEGNFEFTLGDVDFQRCYDAGSENYCASYLSCTTHLPRIYRELPFSPFSSISTDISFSDRQSLPSLRDAFFRLPVTFNYVSPKNAEQLLVYLPKSFVNKLFPKIPSYCKVDVRSLFGVYNLYFKYGCKAETANEFAASLIDSFNYGAIVDSDLKYLYWLYDFKHTPYDTLHRKLVVFYYQSRRASLNALEFGVTLYDYLKQMQRYYSKVALHRLREFYEYQQDLLTDYYHPAKLGNLFGLYKSTDFNNLKHMQYYLDQFNVHCVVDCVPPSDYYAYAALTHKILNDTTKTKKRNDVFEKRGLQRPRYIPRVKSNINHFLSI